MAIDGLIILDGTGRPIIQSGYTAYPPAYPLLHIDTLNNALAKVQREGDIDPVLYVSPGIGDSLAGSACCHIEVGGGLRMIASVSGDADPLIAFSFLQAFLEILYDYFGTISASTLRDNFDIVYQLLEETLDSSGHPLTTSPNALRDIVLPPSLITKLLASVAASAPTSSSGRQPGGLFGGSGTGAAFASPIPWRKAGVKHNHNEILFDVVEEMRGIVGRNGGTLVSNVWGKIESNAKLSGTPDLQLTFTNPNVLTDCAFHPCVRLQRWTRDKALSFVPPDGRFVLAEYQYTGQSAVVSNVPVPLALKTSIDIGEFGGTIHLSLSSRLSTKPMENIEVELYLGDDASGAQCVTSSAGNGVGSVGGAEGSWGFDSRKKVLKWEIPSIGTSGSWVLRGSWTSKSKAPRPAHALHIRFEIPAYNFSSLKVDQLRLSGEGYKMYKGVRGRSLGSIEWRW
ncbi:clathrin adaptor mu subunit [Hygrophoropsis aurantiaca]|uniref:Clathrin adaptor mu subunit n=1 Tax=Hygrophoropsis aurantiaca TaxID=72124 RepID=A0ACB8ATN6_9AGAM|nr:clathrin adaptor mu subunit [Hygrophoropsis aurantiaca]